MNTLKQKLEEFAEWPHNTEDELTNAFKKLAPYFLYGGYIRVHNRFLVYIKCTEFYFHSETQGGIKDDIVYHRNNPDIFPNSIDLPYYEPITFHAHASGVDLAFESMFYHFRASALIRSYEIYDLKKKQFMEVIKGKWNYTDDAVVNTKSLYLYDILNGFGSNGEIEWIDDPSRYLDEHKDLIIGQRERVYLISKPKVAKDGKLIPCRWDKPEYKVPRERNWSFERKESVKDLI